MEQKDKLKLLKTRTGAEKFADTFSFIRVNLAILMRTHLLLSLPVILLTAAVFLLVFPNQFSLLLTIDSGPFVDTTARNADRLQNLVHMLFGFMAIIPVGINTLIVMDRYARSETGKVAWEDVWDGFRRNYLKLFAAKLVMGAVILVAGLFLFVPGLVFYTLFLCVEMLILQHGFGIGKALSRSMNIMSKRGFWPSLFMNLGIFVLMFLGILGMLLMVPILEWLASLLFDEANKDSFWAIFGKVVKTLNTILGYWLYMLPAAAVGIQYFTLREQVGRTDIMERIRRIGMKDEPASKFVGDEQY